MKARQLFRYKSRQGELVIEMVVWQLPATSAERPHGLKYRLHCSRGGNCVVRYDNEAGKGDHIHCGEQESPYRFDSVEKLVADFRADCARLAGWRW